MDDARIRLELEDFRELIRGGVVRKETPVGTVAVALADIGFRTMDLEVSQAGAGAPPQQRT